jgi:hypothetical protein
MEYHTRVVYGRVTLEFFEVAQRDLQRSVRVRWDDRELGIVTFLSPYYPALLLCDGKALIWGGLDIWIIAPSATEPQHARQDEEVRAVYEHGNQFIVVREISVVTVDAVSFAQVSLAALDGPVLSAWWAEGELRVRNLDEAVYSIDCDAQGQLTAHVLHPPG